MMSNELSLDDRLVDENVIKLMYNNFINPPQWMNKANCIQQDLDIKDLQENSTLIQEKYCKTCPVIQQCYKWGEKFEAHNVVYGGKIIKESNNND